MKSRAHHFITPSIVFALLGILCGNSLCDAADTWVAVGYGGRRMISNDGVKWEVTAEWAEKGGDDSNNLMGLAYGFGKFVAVGGGGFSKDKQGEHVVVSKDGREWKEVHSEPFRVSPVVFSGKRFVAGGTERSLLFSYDDETWTNYVHMRANPKGVIHERWCHTYGCRQWFNLVRHTVSHAVLASYEINGVAPEIPE